MKRTSSPSLQRYENLANRKSRLEIRFNNFTLTPPTTTNMTVYQSGHKSECSPGWHTRMTTYDHYIIHYILSGKGIYYAPKQRIQVEQGDLFLIKPFESIHYQADLDQPWTYYWVGFHGSDAPAILKQCGFSDTCLVRSYRQDQQLEETLRNLAYPRYVSIAQEYDLLGNLYRMFSLLIQTNAPQPVSKSEQYLSKAIEYIQQNYLYSDLRVCDVASYVGIDRTYLYRLFYDTFQQSVQDFILDMRLKKAASLLQHSHHPIGVIAFHCGFENQSYFSTVLKKLYHQSPLQYRKTIQRQPSTP